MFDISWSHLLMFGVAAVVLIPTKDLPAVLRASGKYWGDAQRMARDFRGQINDAIRETEIASIKDGLTKDFADIQKSASLDAEAAQFSANMTAAAATAGTQPAVEATGQIIVQAAAMTPAVNPVADADANTYGSGASVPMPPLTIETERAPAANNQNGRKPAERIEGIEIVRAGRGSVAQRAKAASKKSAGSVDSGA